MSRTSAASPAVEHAVGANDSPRVPVATYRVQLHAGFSFVDAAAVVPYLARLGITDAYLSPYLIARPGSAHGYDICDHGGLNPELGGETGFETLVVALAKHGMGHVLDFVPNHMAADPAANPWWRDVLENGPSSAFARFFDIEWDPVKPEIRGKVLLPILSERYGVVLERGELRLELADGRLRLRAFDHDLPIDPRSVPRVLRFGIERLVAETGEGDADVAALRAVLADLEHLPAAGDTRLDAVAVRHQGKEAARARLAELAAQSLPVRGHVERCLEAFSGRPGDSGSFDRLHDLLEAQPYRLAYWRTAVHEINYRRFFDINHLAGLRMEDPVVFEATHRLVLRLIAEGKITGLRLDHLDGLFDPAAYLRRLREAAGSVYLLAEKILSADEAPPREWPLDGTSGYDFLNEVNGLFIDGRNERKIRRTYERFTRRTAPFPIVSYVGKKLVTETSMASELTVLAHALNRISEGDRRSRDFTLESLREALREVVACFPVYRTYVSERGVSDDDRRTIEIAVTRARRRNPAVERSVFDFVLSALLPDPAALPQGEYGRRLAFAMKFQQYTAPVQAKGVEDTAFYRHHALASLNEVGGDPRRFGRTPESFHAANRRRLADWPRALLATATHDTKRGEDARLRIDVLSGIPEDWRAALVTWARINTRNRRRVEGEWAPDRNEEYLFYQSLLGVWPAGAGAEAAAPLVERLRAYMRKAIREAKLHTSWMNVNQGWEEAVAVFVERTLAGPSSARFLQSLLPFARRVAHLGMLSSLAQVVLKISSPGVADFYQGTELWDLSLVDPDNRRPVDYDLRRRLLDELEPVLHDDAAAAERQRTAAALLDSWTDGRIKLYVTAIGLRLRRRLAPVFIGGDYLPLEVTGASAAQVVALARSRAEEAVVAVVPRLVTVPDASWADTRIRLPESLSGRGWRNAFTGQAIRPDGGGIPVAAVLGSFPVALLRADRAVAVKAAA